MNTKQISLLLILSLLFSCSKDEANAPEPVLNTVSGKIYVSGYEEISSDDITTVWRDDVPTAISSETIYPQPLLGIKLNDMFVFNDDVYVAASELIGGTEVATYWKNGVRTQLASEFTSSKAKSIFVTNESVFVAGSEVFDNKTNAVVWRDGVKTVLQEGTVITTVTANSVYVTETGDVYVTGYQYTGGSSTTSILKTWKNGIEEFVSTPQTLANSVFVSNGNVYLAGLDDSGTNSVAVLWTDSVPTALTNGDNRASATDVYVSGNDVYVSGVEKNGTNDVAIFWKNGVATMLTTGTNPAYAHSIFVDGTDVYVAGYEWNGDNKVAMLWENGIAKPLTDGTNEAIAYDVFIVE